MITRYETPEMTAVWEEDAKFARWTRVEVAACEAWHARGQITDADIETIRQGAQPPSPRRVAEFEKVTNHDVVAFVRALAESVGTAGGHLHRGLTSSDVLDTANALAMMKGLDVLIEAAAQLSTTVARRAVEFKKAVCVGRTHGSHAEPTTFGVRLAGWHAEMIRNIERLTEARAQIAFGKLSGALGNFTQIDPNFEAEVLGKLGLTAEPVATQVVPRDRYAVVMTTLAMLGGAVERFAVEIRHLQCSDIREVEEPFGAGQTGSSAMPHKRNPVTCERLTGMARLLRGHASAALESMALWGERDISHSAVERIALPDAFHLSHYMLITLSKVIQGMRVYVETMRRNLDKTRGLIFSQAVLSLLVSKGIHRQEAYSYVQQAAMQVWENEDLDFKRALCANSQVTTILSVEEINQAFALEHFGRFTEDLLKRAGITS